MSRRVRDLLTDAVADVEPTGHLDAIRSRADRRASRRRRLLAGTSALVAAAVVLAVALLDRDAVRDDAEPGPAASPTRSGTVLSPDPSGPFLAPGLVEAVTVYYVGDTPDGPRLYRENRPTSGDELGAAVAAAVGRDPEGRPMAPSDPDYRVPWPPGTGAGARVVASGRLIEVTLGGDPQDDLRERGTLSEVEARLAVEQLVRTAQAAVGGRLPVRILLFGAVADRVLGVPTSEPLRTGSTLGALAHVSITTPSEGEVIDNDEPLAVLGAANGYEGTVETRLERPDGTDAVDPQPTIAGWGQDRLFPFRVRLDLSDVPPGAYVVVSRTDDPTGAGRFHTDTKRITVVD